MGREITENLGFYIQRISRIVSYKHNEMLEEKGITISQFKVLLALWEQDHKTQNEILEEVLVKPSTLTGLINILEKKELVQRIVDSNDARVRRIALTEAGKALEEPAMDTITKMEAEIVKSLSVDEKRLVIELLGRVKQSLETDAM